MMIMVVADDDDGVFFLSMDVFEWFFSFGDGYAYK